jgi:uncharacterized protein
VDQVGHLDPEQRAALEARLGEIQQARRAQIAVLISTGHPDEALAQYALRVAEAWKLGRADRDDGVLIVLVPSEHESRIEVGYGLEGVIPDVSAARWLRELAPELQAQDPSAGLAHLLDRIAAVLPAAVTKSNENTLFPDHPEWRLPFVMAIFSPFALFPLFFGRSGSLVSAPLLAAFIGGAAWLLWGTSPATWTVAGVAFALPPLWGLNWLELSGRATWLGYAKAIGNLIAVALFFTLISVFVGAGLSATDAGFEWWAAPLFAGLLALGLAAFLFPRQTQALLLVLRSYVHFVFILIIAYLAMMNFLPHPEPIALSIAGGFTTLVALALYLDSRNETNSKRWSHWLIGIALVLVAPFALFLLFQAMLGDDPKARLAEIAAGGGSLAGVLAWALRAGFFTALKVGLGGRFGGGGAGGS